VLTACASASMSARARLVGVVARAAAVSDTPPYSSSSFLDDSTSGEDAGLGINSGDGGPNLSSSTGSRSTGASGTGVSSLSPGFKQLCVQKLFQMCGRGCDGQGSNKCHLEVAQLTISPLMERYVWHGQSLACFGWVLVCVLSCPVLSCPHNWQTRCSPYCQIQRM
jgi:hypothetical protein